MSNENSIPVEDQPTEQPQVKGATTRGIRLTTISSLLDKHTTQLDKVGQKFQPLQSQLDKISTMVQPLQKQIKVIEKQTDLAKQIQTQLKQLQKQMSEVQKEIQKVRSLLLSNKKKNFSTTRNRYNKRRESGRGKPR